MGHQTQSLADAWNAILTWHPHRVRIYESALKVDKFLVAVRGTSEDVERARDILSAVGAADITVYLRNRKLNCPYRHQLEPFEFRFELVDGRVLDFTEADFERLFRINSKGGLFALHDRVEQRLIAGAAFAADRQYEPLTCKYWSNSLQLLAIRAFAVAFAERIGTVLLVFWEFVAAHPALTKKAVASIINGHSHSTDWPLPIQWRDIALRSK